MDPSTSPLLTDLYQLNMVQAYLDNGMGETAVFEFFSRRLPRQRRFLVAAGLEQALGFLEQVRFGAEELDWLRASGRFDERFLDYAAAFRFTGDVDAMPEGTVFFADEPILRVTAPDRRGAARRDALINLLHLQSLIARRRRAWCWRRPAGSCSISGSGARTGEPGCRPRAPATSRASPAPPACPRLPLFGIPSSAPWRIPSSRRMATRRRRSSFARARPDDLSC